MQQPEQETLASEPLCVQVAPEVDQWVRSLDNPTVWLRCVITEAVQRQWMTQPNAMASSSEASASESAVAPNASDDPMFQKVLDDRGDLADYRYVVYMGWFDLLPPEHQKRAEKLGALDS